MPRRCPILDTDQHRSDVMKDPKSPAPKAQTDAPAKRVRKPLPNSSADAHAADAHSSEPRGDFFYDELMTAQPDATQEYFRRQLMQHVAKKPESEEPK